MKTRINQPPISGTPSSRTVARSRRRSVSSSLHRCSPARTRTAARGSGSSRREAGGMTRPDKLADAACGLQARLISNAVPARVGMSGQPYAIGGRARIPAARARWHLCRTMTDCFRELDRRSNDRIDVRLLRANARSRDRHRRRREDWQALHCRRHRGRQRPRRLPSPVRLRRLTRQRHAARRAEPPRAVLEAAPTLG